MHGRPACPLRSPNFWIVVNMMPPRLAGLQQLREVLARLRLDRRLRQRRADLAAANTSSKSWSSRSLRSVSTTSVGLPIAGWRMTLPA